MFIWFKRYGIVYKPTSVIGWTIVTIMVGYVIFSMFFLFLKEPVTQASVDSLFRILPVVVGYWFLARITSPDAQNSSRSKNGRIHDSHGFMKF